LAFALHPDRFDADVIDVVQRSTAAETDIAEALANLDGALKLLLPAQTKLEGIEVDDWMGRQAPDDPFSNVKQMLSEGILKLQGCTELLQLIQERKRSAFRKGHKTKLGSRLR
jgi:hypothetical protein